MTNFERIKQMSIDELANMLTIEYVDLHSDILKSDPCKLYQSTPTKKIYISQQAATENVKHWLESEAEE